MNFRAKAKTYKPCAYAKCACMGNKIYEDDKWRVIACSEAHANLARVELDKIPRDRIREFWPEA